MSVESVMSPAAQVLLGMLSVLAYMLGGMVARAVLAILVDGVTQSTRPRQSLVSVQPGVMFLTAKE